MRIEYEVNKDKMCKFLDYFYTTYKSPIDEYFVMMFGYIIDYNLVNYSFDDLGDLCKGEIHHKSPIALATKDLVKFCLDLPSEAPLPEKSIRWLKIGVDFIVTNCKEYILIEVLRKKTIYKEENEVIKGYIIENKDEFPDMYLELLLPL